MDAKTNWKNPVTAHKNETGDVEMKDCNTASNMKKVEDQEHHCYGPGRREYLYLVGHTDGDSPRVGRVMECHVGETDLWGLKGRIREGGRPALW